MKKLLTLVLSFLLITSTFSQKRNINLEDLWKEYTFYPAHIKGFKSMNDGEHYSVMERNENGQEIIKYRFENGRGYKGQKAFSAAIRHHGWDAFTPHIIAFADTKEQLDKLANKYDFIVRADIFFKIENTSSDETGKIAGIRLSAPGPRLFADHSSKSFHESVKEATRELNIQLKKRKDKMKSHH